MVHYSHNILVRFFRHLRGVFNTSFDTKSRFQTNIESDDSESIIVASQERHFCTSLPPEVWTSVVLPFLYFVQHIFIIITYYINCNYYCLPSHTHKRWHFSILPSRGMKEHNINITIDQGILGFSDRRYIQASYWCIILRLIRLRSRKWITMYAITIQIVTNNYNLEIYIYINICHCKKCHTI